MASGELSLTSNDSSQEFDTFGAPASNASLAGQQQQQPPSASSSSILSVPSTAAAGPSALSLSAAAAAAGTAATVSTSDSRRRIDQVMEQLEFYRDHYMVAMKQIEQSAQESTAIRTKYTDVSNENVRLQQRNHHLEKKLTRCMESLKLSAAESHQQQQQQQQQHHHQQLQQQQHGSTGSMPCSFVAECAEWKKKYDTTLLEADAHRIDLDRYKKHCDDLSRDRNSLALEKDELKQQLAGAQREKAMYHVDIKEMNKVMQSRAEELRRITAQRNAAEHELRTILAERKGVLEENQKLADDLAAAREELAQREKQCAYDGEALRRELDAERRFREELVAECGVMRDQLAKAGSGGGEGGAWPTLKDDTQAAALGKELANLEAANAEAEKLRKQLERAYADTAKATTETEVAKSRRDWAISEREKIVLERDSVKYLCDELRKERDTAISELLAAIRDSEKIKKQKDEACREVEFMREQLDVAQHHQVLGATSSTSSRRSTARWSCAGPFDRALEHGLLARGADLEVLELDMSSGGGGDGNGDYDHDHERPKQHDFGLTLEGGRDSDSTRTDSGGVFVVSVAPTSPAYGHLRPNDCIVQINQLDCTGASKRTVLDTLRATAAAPSCRIVVRRPRANRSHMYAVQLNLTGNGTRNHGIQLETGVFIARIAPGSLAAREGCELLAGDRVLSVNSRSMEGVRSAKEAMALLDDNRPDTLTIISLKQIAQREPPSTAASAPSTSAVTTVAGRAKHSKMTNTCTQTESGWMLSSATSSPLTADHHAADHSHGRSFAAATQNSKSTSKISEMINKFKEKMHMPGTSSGSGGGSSGHGKQSHSTSPPTRGSNVSDADSMCLERDAIQVLDSVLNMENGASSTGKSKDNLLKRSKRSSKKDAKEANKNLGTWPRANILLSSSSAASSAGSEGHHAGTIVQHRKKERPALSFFTGPLGLGRDQPEAKQTTVAHVPPVATTEATKPNYFQPQVVQHKSAAVPPSSSASGLTKSSAAQQSNRQSNPVPFVHVPPPPPQSQIVNRHSVYSTSGEMEQQQQQQKQDSMRTPAILPQQQLQQQNQPLPNVGVSYTLSRTPKYQDTFHHQSHHHHHASTSGYHPATNPNRLSLNIPSNHMSDNSAHHLYNTLTSQHSKPPPPSIPQHKSALQQQQPPMLPAKCSLDHLPASAAASFKSSVDSFGTPLSLPKSNVSSMDFKRLSMTSPQQLLQHHQQLQHQQQQQQQHNHHSHQLSSSASHHHQHQLSAHAAAAASASIKSQNSIDSCLSTATTPGGKSSIDLPMKQSTSAHQTSRDSFDMYGGSAAMRDPQRISRNSAKFPSDSDSLSMSDAIAHSGPPSRLSRGHPQRVAPISGYPPPSLAFGGPPSGQYMMAHHHGGGQHSIRQSSPLTLSPAQQTATMLQAKQHHQSSVDKVDFEYAAHSSAAHHHHHHDDGGHGVSMDVLDLYGGSGGGSTAAGTSGTVIQQTIGKPTAVMSAVAAAPYYHHGGHGGAYEGGTFPRKKENQRFRIPSNPSVVAKNSGVGGAGVKNSTGSIEQQGGVGGGGSERGSPMPPAFQVEVLSHGANKRNSMPDYCYGQKPSPGDLRRVTIDKSVELGITIACNVGGGIFVSTVAENSIASQVGLQIGDQLLEVCGINMRNATYDLAANVLRQCGNSITMLVQYSPDKFDRNARLPRSSEDDIVSRSGSPTPRNSPRTARDILMGMYIDSHSGAPHPATAPSVPSSSSSAQAATKPQQPLSQHPPQNIGNPAINTSISCSSSSSAGSGDTQTDSLQSSVAQQPLLAGAQQSSHGTAVVGSASRPNSVITSQHSLLMGSSTIKMNPKYADSLEQQSVGSSAADLSRFDGSSGAVEPRLLTITTKKNTNLGISLMGGNAVGIYVHDVQKSSLADAAGMRMGDQILEYNGADLRRVTAEQAANEISRPVEKVTMVVQHNFKKFNQIKDEAGDSLYIRVGFDRTGDLGEGELRFVKDDVLYVDTTIFRGVFGQWRAWKLDEYGHRLECGIIPSQLKVEEELRLLSDITGDGGGDGTARRGSTSARRSFFRRKKHPRSSSRDSKEVASFSNTQLSWFSDSGMLSEEGTMLSYQRVERLDYSVCRPVLIIGPLADCVADKLSIDFPMVFDRCMQTPMNCTADAMEKGMLDNIFVDYRKRGSIFECTTVQAIRDIGDRNHHCILDVCISAVERLQRLQIYPIVLLLRFKSAKQIKEIKDSRYSTDKISAKAAKEMYEHTLKLESDYRQYISAVIPAGVNITHMSTQIKAAVDEEQTKVLWVPLANQ